jgi:hypothetical protein
MRDHSYDFRLLYTIHDKINDEDTAYIKSILEGKTSKPPAAGPSDDYARHSSKETTDKLLERRKYLLACNESIQDILNKIQEATVTLKTTYNDLIKELGEQNVQNVLIQNKFNDLYKELVENLKTLYSFGLDLYEKQYVMNANYRLTFSQRIGLARGEYPGLAQYEKYPVKPTQSITKAVKDLLSVSDHMSTGSSAIIARNTNEILNINNIINIRNHSITGEGTNLGSQNPSGNL